MNGIRRILIADDNRDVADLLSQLIGSFGHEVHTCYDGKQARSAIASLRPELVMLDISMPGMNGCELARWARQLEGGAETRLIALTGLTATEDRELMSEAGFDAIFTKPLDFDGLQREFASDNSA